MADKDIELLDQIIQDYRITFGSETGARVLADLLEYTGTFRSTFNSDPMIMAKDEGIRSVGLHILNMRRMEIAELANLPKQAVMNHDD